MASVEMMVMAAEDLKNVSLLGKMSPYVVVWVDPYAKQTTRIAKKGGKDPIWNHAMSLPVEEFALSNPYACLTVQICSQGSVRDVVVGTAWLPLHEIARLSTLRESDEEPDIVTLHLQRPSGRVQGIIRLSVRLAGAGFPARIPTPTTSSSTDNNKSLPWRADSPPRVEALSSPRAVAAEPVEGIPVLGYAMPPPHYSTTTGSYSYHHQAHSAASSFPYNSQVPYLAAPSPPSAPPIPAPPPPPTRRQAGNGLLLGLLGGVLGAILLGDILL